jgi:hypothetical protein
MGGVIDLISGRVTLFPFSICCSAKAGEPDFQPVLVRPNSRLIVFVGMRSEEQPDADHFYEFTGSGFSFLASSAPFSRPLTESKGEPRAATLQEALPSYTPTPKVTTSDVPPTAHQAAESAPQSAPPGSAIDASGSLAENPDGSLTVRTRHINGIIQIRITSKVDTLRIDRIRVNRDNCSPTASFDFPITLAFGQYVDYGFFVQCIPIEVELHTNIGVGTYETSD